MKNMIILLSIFTLLLAACGNSQAVSTQTNDTLPMATVLVLGTLQLEGADQAVTSAQAKELLPMWQVYRSLINSDNAAQEEIDGLVEQIQETLTSEQMAAITGMNLTQQDVFTVLQAQNITASNGGNSQNSNFDVSFGPPDGGMPGGGLPDAGMGGGAPPDGGMGDMAGMVEGVGPSTNTDPSEIVKVVARSAGVPTPLVEALIQLLEQRAGAA